jgi:long-subunit acyl-CoA synthetase (AMP-forming)
MAQVGALKATSMACPPNIWAGLYDDFVEDRASMARKAGVPVDAVHDAGLKKVADRMGGKMKSLATGGAATPQNLLNFAASVCHASEIGFVDSYGATECGAITANGRQFGSKFNDMCIALVDHPELGFTSNDRPYPRGEVA